MPSVEDVAAYILAKDGPMSAMKLQKLCYFAYGYHLAWEDRQLFPERFEAWANGPVSYELYDQHRGRYQLNAGDVNGDPSLLDDGERESVTIVLDSMGVYSAHELSAMTHRAGPWVQARERAGAADLQRSNEELRDADIADFFGALVSQDDE
ncbi:Panacea domain-containing protein [Streptomyces natalensis]|uniref:Prophage ps3 protein 01 n=1 Tax=Streptomyces natalensis ATCC 27448 TaxID=1240678 RepID=A0A0D7CLB8_9ACTN|nr:type II toxin-antitoxin system antitoxin SocA domain-containing protein [Streptomyces natalensis]KIZ16871.1 prophage ps3 protein 01 [Streptomyces natalensis ATCC 27448]